MAFLPVVFSIGIVVIVAISFYKAFFRKKVSTPAYTPFDEITGQSPTAFPENSVEIVLDERSGDGKGNG
ncbi:hypothetical protein DRW41_19320 [Neobacillus piezotolerans]|uniref:DUF3951 domain-containing protein n=1 Tax=Neobacillus piezotolerans TaxID=2259171 RepID=A0A3D8GLD3_9BACI|nr:DUF3951 domain-containing protein [Neobacillus piezotolerans]RDU35264.1 hypothetical protein DRW41_19320 [Neobacillus piezotolerans]